MTAPEPHDLPRAAKAWALVAIVVAATMVAQAFGRFTYALVLPAVQRDLGITYTLAGTLGTLNLGAYLIGSLTVAVLSSRLTPERIMRLGIGVCVVGLTGMWWAPNLGVVIAAMVVTGFGGASIWIPAPAVTSSLVPERQRSLAIGTVGAGIGIGFITAGWVARSVGEAWRTLYGIETLLGIVIAISLWVFLRGPVEADARRPSLRSLGGVPRWRRVLVSYGSYGLSMSLFVNFFVARLEEDSGVPAPTTALIFATFGVASIFGGPLFGFISDAIGRNRALVLGFVAMATSSLVLLIGFGVWPWLATLVFGLAFTGIPATTATYLRDHLSAREFGSAFGVVTLAFGAGQFVAPQIGGFLADQFSSFASIFVLAAVVAIVAGFASAPLASHQFRADSRAKNS